ncbi:MAG: hypothetical protein RML36_02050 [Anaerolineae bacterium]|nr:hypothetical protein [Anaerolineae bacterium]MDW8098251.1 hypothetical protein [Anaerolineae bacterium]
MARHRDEILSLPLPDKPREKPLPWAEIAERFDRFIMDPDHQVVYTDPKGHIAFTAFLESPHYGGMRHELVTFGPIVLGKALRGEDVRPFLPSLAGYFCDEVGLFLNTPGQLRIEYWYLMYVHALAWQIIRRVGMEDAGLVAKWRRSMETLRQMAQSIRYDFNAQGFDFRRCVPWTRRAIFRQPDAIGAYGYLMLLAYETFGEGGLLEEAVNALDRYLAFPSNPWYEIPSGAMATLAIARLVKRGIPLDLHRALNFALDPLAHLILGQWGGREVHGLCRGWRFSQPESAYSMESMILLPYLLPVARYAPEYARVIGRYALNVASNMRLFYSEYMRGIESRPDLSPAVPYERLFQSYNGQSPYAAGDFHGHKSIYGGAYALWWGAVIAPTNNDFILKLDLTKTDFLAHAPLPAFLYYNPWPEARTVQVAIGEGPSDFYDAATGDLIGQRICGEGTISLPPIGTRAIILTPAAKVK